LIDRTVIFSRGVGNYKKANNIIGADGHRSTVQRHVAPHKPNATFAGYMIRFAIVDENGKRNST
jgi:2-polyprenyl-6-methoxyphenol hydroxylase-like FAD-dependent oxidoreductase